MSERVRLGTSDGLSVNVIVRTPDDIVDGDIAPELGADELGRHPLVLILGGHRTGERAALLVGDTRGAVVAAMGYPYDGPADISGLAVLRHVPRIRRALLDTPPAIQLALDYLLSRPDVDPTRVELVGVSFGAPFAVVAAALDQRVTRLWLIHAAGRPYTLLEHNLERSVPYAAPRALVAAVANIVIAGPRLAPEVWVPHVAPRPVIMINASDDERLPREAVETLYANALEPKEQIWLSGRHVHPAHEEVVRQLVDVVLSRAAEDPT